MGEKSQRKQIQHAIKEVFRGLVTIHPADAEEALRKLPNGLNRSQRYLGKCEQYRERFSNGEWVINGDTVVFDEDGFLVDGEARMRACVMSGVPFTTFVIRGIRKEAVETLQSGVSRSGEDALTIDGEPYAKEAAGAWNVVAGYLRMLDTGKGYSAFSRPEMSPERVLALCEAFPNMIASARFVRGMGAGLRSLGPNLATAVHYFGSMVDPEATERFFETYAAGRDRTGCPCAEIRRHFARSHRVRQDAKLGCVIKAFNRFRAGDDVTPEMVVYSTEGNGQDAGEVFPRFEALPVHDPLPQSRKRDPRRKASGLAAAAKGVSIEIRLVTPAECEYFVTVNGPIGTMRNRELKPSKVDAIARDQTNSRFEFNGQTMKFSRSGRMLDGQHRAYACIKSGRPFITAIVTGLDDEVFSTLDEGPRRSVQHHLRGRGVKHLGKLLPVINLYNKAMGGRKVTATNGEMIEDVERHAALRELMECPRRRSMLAKSKMPPSAAWALYYMVHPVNPEAADTFFLRLSDLQVGPGSPIIPLHLHLVGAVSDKTRNPEADKLLMGAMAVWNLWRSGVTTTQMPTATSFPKLLP